MKNKLFIDESEKSRILEMHQKAKNILLNEEIPYNPLNNQPKSIKQNTVQNINPKKLKIGDGTNKNPSLRSDVKILQQKLIELGCLPKGSDDGRFGNITNKALINYQKNGSCDTKNKDGHIFSNHLLKPKNKGPLLRPSQTANPEQNLNVSDQVKKQLEYLKTNNILSDESFTIVDDKNSKVHAFTPDYKLYRTFNVITGRDIGDKIKTETMTDFVLKNIGNFDWKKFFNVETRQQLFDAIDNCYFNQKEWLIRNTPSGVFKRAGNISNFMNDIFATKAMENDYGKRFITWETLDGKTIPFGFHGTKSSARLDVLNNSKSSCSKKNMSFGCINFNENDITQINAFITAGQISIWLPDETNDIVPFEGRSFISKVIDSPWGNSDIAWKGAQVAFDDVYNLFKGDKK